MSVSGLNEVALDAALVDESNEPALEARRAFQVRVSEETERGEIGSTSGSEGARALMAAV